MLLALIKLAFCLSTIIVIALAAELVGGTVGWIIASIACIAMPLFGWGCRTAERRGISDYRRLRRANARHILSNAREVQDVREVGQ